MKITLENLGALQYAEFSLGDMTIICGGNNTGKTYAAYSLYGFLHLWKKMISIEVSHAVITELLSNGLVAIDLTKYIKEIELILQSGCENYSSQIPKVFSTSSGRLKTAKFSVELDFEQYEITEEYHGKVSSVNSEQFSFTKEKGNSNLIVTLLTEQHEVSFPHRIVSNVVSEAIEDILFGHYFPTPYIASAERTGAAIFRKELNFSRNRLLKEMSQTERADPFELLFKNYQDYALPVEKDVDFIRQLESLSKKTGYLQKNHSGLLEDFANIIGGNYQVSKDDELYFVPESSNVKLTMDESSSAVRSLLGIGFYLKHLAKVGDILIVDEPELNLHPENQRKVARLFARLVNIGIKVFITTHSDYIIKEINTLIMLNSDKTYIKNIREKENYHQQEVISAKKIKVYIAEKAAVKRPNNTRKTQCQTLVSADIDENLGIEARSFDKTIDEMNRVQDEIIWGED